MLQGFEHRVVLQLVPMSSRSCQPRFNFLQSPRLLDAGSPFHPHIIDPRKVKVDGGWHMHTDASGQLEMKLGETKKILVDTASAGPG